MINSPYEVAVQTARLRLYDDSFPEHYPLAGTQREPCVRSVINSWFLTSNLYSLKPKKSARTPFKKNSKHSSMNVMQTIGQGRQ